MAFQEFPFQEFPDILAGEKTPVPCLRSRVRENSFPIFFPFFKQKLAVSEFYLTVITTTAA